MQNSHKSLKLHLCYWESSNMHGCYLQLNCFANQSPMRWIQTTFWNAIIALWIHSCNWIKITTYVLNWCCIFLLQDLNFLNKNDHEMLKPKQIVHQNMKTIFLIHNNSCSYDHWAEFHISVYWGSRNTTWYCHMYVSMYAYQWTSCYLPSSQCTGAVNQKGLVLILLVSYKSASHVSKKVLGAPTRSCVKCHKWLLHYTSIFICTDRGRNRGRLSESCLFACVTWNEIRDCVKMWCL